MARSRWLDAWTMQRCAAPNGHKHALHVVFHVVCNAELFCASSPHIQVHRLAKEKERVCSCKGAEACTREHRGALTRAVVQGADVSPLTILHIRYIIVHWTTACVVPHVAMSVCDELQNGSPSRARHGHDGRNSMSDDLRPLPEIGRCDSADVPEDRATSCNQSCASAWSLPRNDAAASRFEPSLSRSCHSGLSRFLHKSLVSQDEASITDFDMGRCKSSQRCKTKDRNFFCKSRFFRPRCMADLELDTIRDDWRSCTEAGR